jgi:hydroxymethylpyrimidine pyrophosphatase-like HAD family hydrolase
MRAIAFVDLDDTLFQTIRKCPGDVPESALTPLGFAKDGSPLSYATPRQMAFIAWLTETTVFIPVTARGLDGLRRVRIPFTAAICAHGGVVLDETGKPDPVWALHIAAQAQAHTPTLNSLANAVNDSAARLGTPLSVRVLHEGSVALYVLVKHPHAIDAELNAVIDSMLATIPVTWTVHRNGNNIAIMPPYLGKAHAVAHIVPGLRARYPDAPTLGIGDSLTDAPYMQLCDFAMTPTGSQLAAAFYTGSR